MLFGRAKERATIEQLLNAARHGTSRALVLRGEAGIGKTELLRYATDLAEAMAVLQATGIEAEAELEFSGLLELLRPELDRLDELTEHQAATLRGALGLAPAEQGDRFATGAATLALLVTARCEGILANEEEFEESFERALRLHAEVEDAFAQGRTLLQVALQVSEGKTNKEVGAALFLSPKTVEFHLARVFRKLELSSRAELIRHFATAAPSLVEQT